MTNFQKRGQFSLKKVTIAILRPIMFALSFADGNALATTVSTGTPTGSPTGQTISYSDSPTCKLQE